MPKVLFVEDEPNHISIYQTKLQQEGFDFVSARNSQEAFDVISKERPDLIMLDLLLINENGLDILAKLKKDEKYKGIPVIVFTNYDEVEYKEQAMGLGAREFVPKAGVTPSQMVTKIKGILD